MFDDRALGDPGVILGVRVMPKLAPPMADRDCAVFVFVEVTDALANVDSLWVSSIT